MSVATGLPPGVFTFFEDLSRDNSREFWQANRPRWEREVRNPVRDLLSELDSEFGPLRMFRPNRDLRFAKDAAPYKLWTGATTESRAVGGIGYYLEVLAKGVVAGYGAMTFAPDQLRRFRGAIAAERSGPEFERLAYELSLASGAEPPLTTAPRGYSADHPRIRHLRWKGAAMIAEWTPAAWMRGPELVQRIRDVWRNAAPLRDWLDEHVAQPATAALAR